MIAKEKQRYIAVCVYLGFCLFYFAHAEENQSDANILASYVEPTSSSFKVIFTPAHLPANFIFSPHKLMYGMPCYYAKDLDSFYRQEALENQNRFSYEGVKTQLSVKLLLLQLNTIDTYLAYTLCGHFKFYHTKAPYFKAYNHQIDVFSEYPLTFYKSLFNIRLGYVHQSNEKDYNNPYQTHLDQTNQKGSWGRIFTSIKFDVYQLSVLLKFWYIFQFNELATKTNHPPLHMRDFLGYGKITLTYHFDAQHYISLSKRLFESKEKRAWDRSWEVMYLYPVLPAVQIMVRGFSGYGANLSRYDYPTFGIGCGIALQFI